jgi:hypothetical protein
VLLAGYLVVCVQVMDPTIFPDLGGRSYIVACTRVAHTCLTLILRSCPRASKREKSSGITFTDSSFISWPTNVFGLAVVFCSLLRKSVSDVL